MRTALLRAYWTVEQVIAPGLTYSQTQYEAFLARYVTSSTRWLDIGCGHQVLPDWRLQQERELVSRAAGVIGIDPDCNAIGKHKSISSIRLGTADSLPFPDASFDLVTANMVVEHLANPENAFREVARVLSENGTFLFHTPNARGYATMLARLLPHWACRHLALVFDGRSKQDVYRTYYRANSDARIRELATEVFGGCDVVETCSTALFATVLPIAVLELCWIRLTQLPG